MEPNPLEGTIPSDAVIETETVGGITREKKEKRIPVVEMFGPTIQGEGHMAGVRTTFIRFGLCDYKCRMCDSMHAVDPLRVRANATWMTEDDIYNEYFNQFRVDDCRWVTFSGGNPAMHNLERLTVNLQHQGISVAVETQGTLNPDWLQLVDCLTISPKSPGMGEQFEQDKFEDMLQCTAHNKESNGLNIKVVVFSAQDLEFARHINEIALNYGLQDRMYLSLGNPFPPGLDEGIDNNKLKLELLESYRQVSEDLLAIPDLYNVRFFPQLHVLAWANKQGV